MDSRRVTKWRTAIVVLVCVLMMVGGKSLRAQSGSGSITGTVTDQRGQAVAGATVVVASPSKIVQTVTSGADGKFAVSGLGAGTYSVETSATGFGTDVRRNVVVTAGETASVPVGLSVASVSEEVTVEAEADSSIAVQNAPVKALLDAASARTEITSGYIRDFTSPVTDFSDITQAAPGTVTWSVNGIGNGQAKTYYRGFADGNYTMTWDGVPFQDSNDPTHHSWAYVPAPAISYVDFDRSPGTASDIGPANFGGSIHMFSPKLGDAPLLKGSESYGSFNTNEFLGEINSGAFAKGKAHFWLEGHHMTSDGYQTNNFQARTAATAKFDYKFSDSTYLTLVGTSVLVDSNTPNNDATRAQLAQFGDNYLMDSTKTLSSGNLDPFYYRFYTYHVPTNFEVVTLTSDLGKGWKIDLKPYTYSYSNHQHYNNYFGSDFGQAKQAKGSIANDAINKLNQYNRLGGILSLSGASQYGVFRTGLWYEYTNTNRYQQGSNPLTWVDSQLISDLKFHEHFRTQSVQPYAEYQLVAIPKWTITVGVKDAFYQMVLKQFADGKTVGSLGCAKGSTIAGCPNFVTHGANYNSWLPSFEANYRIRDNWSAYAQYGRGSVIPPSSVFDVTGAQVAVTPKPIVASTYQGGSVVKLNRVSFDGDFYYIHYQSNYSSFTPSSGPDSGFTFYYQNPASNTYGVEGEGNFALTRALSFFVNGTYGQAKYESAAAQAATATAPAVAASTSAWVANTPNYTATEGLTYRDKRFDFGMFNKTVGDRWQDDGPYHQAVPLNPFTMTNVFLNYTVRGGSLFEQSKIKLSVNNLLDNHDQVSISPANSVTANGVPYTPNAADTIQLLPGRSFMVTFQIGLSPKER
ncbi:TonB-dependent receptor [Acidobacteria bacterium AB60]|nr:TonB-dependent receptor [Acidobacteria bacterium AB60]